MDGIDWCDSLCQYITIYYRQRKGNSNIPTTESFLHQHQIPEFLEPHSAHKKKKKWYKKSNSAFIPIVIIKATQSDVDNKRALSFIFHFNPIVSFRATNWFDYQKKKRATNWFTYVHWQSYVYAFNIKSNQATITQKKQST